MQSVKRYSCIVLYLFLLALPVFAQNRIIVNADLGKDKISKHIYGHFAEHLGNCR